MSTLKADTIQNTSGGAATLTKQHASKVWTNMNQQTPAYRDSFNVSSLTDSATGRIRTNITSSMSDGNYATVTGGGDSDTSSTYAKSREDGFEFDQTSSIYEQLGANGTATGYDITHHMSAVHGDLA